MAAGATTAEEAVQRAYQLHRAGRSQEAASRLVAAIRTYPRLPAPYKLLADVQRSLGNRTAEAAVLEELTSLEPLNAVAWRRVAELKAERGSSEEAYRAYRHACRLSPEEGDHWQGLGMAALASQRFERAQEACEQLSKRFPRRAASQLLAGHIGKALGNRDEARAAYDASLAMDPASTEAIYNRIDLDPPSPDDALALRVQSLLNEPGLGDAELANLSFARARILEAARQYEEAFEHYEQANAAAARMMAARGIVYRPEEAEAWLARTLACYARPFHTPLEPLAIDLRPIFIVGMPRSGTSVVEQILASHPRVAAGGELSIAADCESAYLRRREESGMKGPIDTQRDAERELLMEARQYYIDRLFEHDLDAGYVTDKLPGNFARVAFLRLLFPDAVIVHTRRHPAATCWSLFASNFALHDPYYNSLPHLAHYYRCYERLMSHWRSLLRPSMLEIRYEDLVLNPEAEIRRLIQGSGLAWEDGCLAFHDNPRPVLTASCSQVRQPLYATSVEHWQHYRHRLGPVTELRS